MLGTSRDRYSVVVPAADNTTTQNLVYVGTYTRSGRSQGIHVFQRDPASGTLTFLHAVAEVDPSFLTFDPSHRFLFAVSEGLGLNGGAVASFKVDGPTGQLTPLSHQPSLVVSHVTCAAIRRDAGYLSPTTNTAVSWSCRLTPTDAWDRCQISSSMSAPDPARLRRVRTRTGWTLICLADGSSSRTKASTRW